MNQNATPVLGASILRAALTAGLVILLSQTPVFADCQKDSKGEVFCGAGDCRKDRRGVVWCARFDRGAAMRTRSGDVVCGRGKCARTTHGDIFCSTAIAGSVTTDRFGRVRCQGACDRAASDHCESVIAAASAEQPEN